MAIDLNNVVGMTLDDMLDDLPLLTNKYVDDPAIIDAEIRCLKQFAFFCGSRWVLGDNSVAKGTDFDFYAEDTPLNREYLAEFGWVIDEIDTDYMDEVTTAIFKKKIDGQLLPIQVVLKDPEKFYLVERFWGLMKKNQTLFITKFWKSYVDEKGKMPNTQELIRERIDNLYNDILPFINL
jgi:hypothetical protein